MNDVFDKLRNNDDISQIKINTIQALMTQNVYADSIIDMDTSIKILKIYLIQNMRVQLKTKC